jgi:hypothetical protein
MRRKGYTSKQKTDNSHYSHKLALREKYAGLVDAELCFDLFCGTGTFAQAMWAPRFKQVVCIDKSRRQLEQLPDLPNVAAYQGDNAKLLSGLLVKYGAPDIVDLDAYGWPDPLAHDLLTTSVTDKRFAIVATDGSMKARQRGTPNALPECYGFGKHLTFAQYGAAMDAAAVRAHTMLREWATIGGKAVVDFDAYVCGTMLYWAALIEPQDVTSHGP